MSQPVPPREVQSPAPVTDGAVTASSAARSDRAPLSAQAEETRGAGRGGLAVAGAKVWFILVGLVQQTVLPHLIGMSGYGAFSTVLAVANIPNNVVTASSIQGVSRAVAGAAPGTEDEAQRKVLLVHAALAPCLAVLFFLAAPFAADFEHAPHIVRPLRIFACVLFVYGLYTPLVGALNGRRRFLAQAGLDVVFATLRTVGLLGAAYALGRVWDGPTGSAIGVATAAAVILPIAWFVAGSGRRGAPGRENAGITALSHLGVLGPIALGQLFLNLLMQSDIWLLRRFTHESGELAGVSGDALRTSTDALVGAYRAAQLFAFLPYQLLLSITFILFPMVARARAQQDDRAVASYVQTGFRLAVILAGLMVSCTSGLGPWLIRLAFPLEAATQGGEALRILALGQGAFAIFGIETTVLVSLSRERASAVVTGIAASLVGGFCWWLVPSSPFDSSLLVRSATATSLALALAAVGGGILVYQTAKSFTPVKTLLRTALAMTVAITLGSRLPWLGRPALLVEVALVAAVYLGVSIATGELGKKDLDVVLGALGKKKPTI